MSNLLTCVVELRFHAYHPGIQHVRGGPFGAMWDTNSRGTCGAWREKLPSIYMDVAPLLEIEKQGGYTPKANEYRVFQTGDLIIVGSDDPDHVFEKRSLQGDGVYGVAALSAGAGYDSFPTIRDRAAKYYAEVFYNKGSASGALNARKGVRLSEFGLQDGTTLTAYAHTSMADAVLAAARAAFAESETFYELVVSDSEPSYEDYRPSGNPVINCTFNDSAIQIQAHGPGSVDVVVPCYAVYDGTSVTLYDMLPSGIHAETDEARDAATAWDKSYKRAVVQKSEGRQVVMPSAVRPIATMSEALEPRQRAHYDAWWEHAKVLRASLEVPSTLTPKQGFSNYTSSGGTATEAEWLDGATAREDAAAALPNSGFWSGLGSVLGTTGEYAVEGVKWIGNSAVDLLKTWGPTGTLQVYGGVKAVNAVTGPSFEKYLPWIVAGAGLLLVLR